MSFGARHAPWKSYTDPIYFTFYYEFRLLLGEILVNRASAVSVDEESAASVTA